MALALTSSFQLALTWLYTNAVDLSTATESKTLTINDSLASGNSLDQANRIFSDQRTLASSASDSLDLYGSLTDGFGTTLNFSRIAGILIQNTSTTAGDYLSVGNGTNGIASCFGNANDIIKIQPNGLVFLWAPSAAGYAVVDTSADVLKILNSGANSITYNIVLIGSA